MKVHFFAIFLFITNYYTYIDFPSVRKVVWTVYFYTPFQYLLVFKGRQFVADLWSVWKKV